MQTVGFWSHVGFRLLRRLLLTSRSTIWWYLGYLKLYRRVYERSANVEKIIWRSKADVFFSIKPYHFLGLHERFAHPSYVLRDDIILCCLTVDEAIFVQLPTSIKNYTGDRCPFLWITLFENALRTITMPLESLNRLAETDRRVEKFHPKPLLMSNSGRCGSTLLAKLIQTAASDRILVLSEPDPLQGLQEYTSRYKAKYGRRGFLRLCRNVMLLSFKPVQNIEAIVIKIRMTTMRVMKYIHESTPEIKHIYVQRRDRLKTVQSWERAFGQALEAKIFNFVCRLGLIYYFVKYAHNAEPDQMRVLNAGLKNLNWTMFETLAMLWADNTCAYEYCRKNYAMPTIYYEDMMTNPMQALEMIFRLINFDLENSGRYEKLFDALKSGLESDSQKGTPLSMEAIDNRKSIPLTMELKNRVNAFLDDLNIPKFD